MRDHGSIGLPLGMDSFGGFFFRLLCVFECMNCLNCFRKFQVLMMGDSEVAKFGLKVGKNEKNGFPRGLDPAISKFFVQLQSVVKVSHLSVA